MSESKSVFVEGDESVQTGGTEPEAIGVSFDKEDDFEDSAPKRLRNNEILRKKPYNPNFVRTFRTVHNGDMTTYVFKYDRDTGKGEYAANMYTLRDEESDSYDYENDNSADSEFEIRDSDIYQKLLSENQLLKERLSQYEKKKPNYDKKTKSHMRTGAMARFANSSIPFTLTQTKSVETAGKQILSEHKIAVSTKSLFEVRKCIEKIVYKVGMYNSRNQRYKHSFTIHIRYWKQNDNGDPIYVDVPGKNGKFTKEPVRISKTFEVTIEK